ncbi:INO80 complex, subunit Ies4 [Pyrenochaeta sp. MPI-SDFR-AT-0127]|nr:INO80 complex, subunit Ies4 [Pyrenochaeta sp. MPI-SDFR-AT-0127]
MSTKPIAKSKIITLRLSRASLSTFPHDQPAELSPESKPNSSPSDTPAAPQIVEPTPADTPADSTATMNGASTPSSLAPPAAKRKGPKPGTKRSATVMEGQSPATPKARGKPGPKRKKLGDILNDPNDKGPFAGPTALQKLGPKANQGAINANLRALDRTGKFKCRKWEKKGFKIRSFTGVVFDLPSWKAPPKAAAFPDDVKSDSTGSSDSKIKDESSAISEKSGLNGDVSTPAPTPLNGIASSPAPIPAA